jgi:hypothetical protein
MKKTVIAFALAAALTFFASPAKAAIFVSNYKGNTISQIASDGTVSTFSGGVMFVL